MKPVTILFHASHLFLISAVFAGEPAPATVREQRLSGSAAQQLSGSADDRSDSHLIRSQPNLNEEIVVTASALPEPLESTPAAVTVISKEQIDERAARDVADLLREVPGLNVSRTGSAGRATSLFTRGAHSTHTLVLWNGVEINNPYFAGYDWGRFSTAGVEQVEVVRGPFSALYGSDAVAGVVNILTAPARNGVRVVAEGGGHGLRNAMAAGSWVGRGQFFTGSFERREDAGFAANDDFGQTSANAMWSWTSQAQTTLGVAGRYTSYELGVPMNLNGAATALIPSPLRRQSGSERQIALPLSQVIGRTTFDLTLSESRRNDDFSDPDDPYGYVSATTESRTRRARLQARVPTVAGTIVAGGELERETVDDRSNFGTTLDRNQRKQRSFFVEDRLTHALANGSRIEVSAGARYDRFDTFGSETSPRVALAWVHGSRKIRVAAGSAFRAPSIGELYFPFSGNRDLAPERTKSYEVGFDSAAGRGSFAATIFRSRFRDLIVFDNARYVFANLGRATAQGLELGYSRPLTDNLRASLSYTFLDTNEDATGDPLPRRPRHAGSLFVGYRTGDVDTNVVVAHNGSRLDVLPVAPFARVNDRGYTTVDVNVQVHLERFTPYVKIENATDTRYEEVRGYPSPSRRAIVGLRFQL